MKRIRTAAMLCTVGLVAAACSSSSGNSSDTTAAAGTTAAPATTAATGSSAPGTTATTGGSSGSTPSSVDTSKNEASDTGVTKDTVTIGLITSATGVASSTFKDTADGANARIQAQNAAGGVYGRKIILKVADDASTIPGDLTASQSLVQQDKVFAVIGYSPYQFGGYRYLQQQGIPVAGSGFDGPEWHTLPNTNMFSWAAFSSNGDANETDGNLWKKLGATTMAGISYADSPSSTGSIAQMKTSVEKAGLKMPVIKAVPFGTVDVTGPVLEMKSAKVDGATCSCVDTTNLAMMGAIKNSNLPNFKGAVAYSGPTDNVFANSTATAAAEGNYFRSEQTLIIDQTNPAMQTWKANLTKYIPSYKGSFPTYGVRGGYISADLMIQMLLQGGQNPTRKSVMDNTRANVHDYDAEGIQASSVDFALDKFTQTADEVCFYYPTVKSGKWVDTVGKICGARIPNSAPKQ
jgi:branched-chain amino acid transport system substrate-binding protein